MNHSFGQRDPDERGYYGAYGGRFVPETLVAPVEELERAYMTARRDPGFRVALENLLRDYVGRPTPLYEAQRLSKSLGGGARLGQRSASKRMAGSAPVGMAVL